MTYLPGTGSRSGTQRSGTASSTAPRRCVQGRVVAPPVADPYAAVVWVPTRPDGAADDVEPTWVRHDRLVEIAHPNAVSGVEDARP
ncbi:hypothetical protein [Saccharomonospora sp. CUA-673]|uniref:hypothetical protein n=1 Tax=Saccharomonospora sp. CUA-673 TaxID=1904969 RepID=UPI002101B3C8|nr:hypothetical protein [Saccharomonospora sp. CUA-673]